MRANCMHGFELGPFIRVKHIYATSSLHSVHVTESLKDYILLFLGKLK